MSWKMVSVNSPNNKVATPELVSSMLLTPFVYKFGVSSGSIKSGVVRPIGPNLDAASTVCARMTPSIASHARACPSIGAQALL